MSRTYTKLFQTILDSTVWQEDLPTKVLWVTMLAMADRDGIVWAAVPGLAHRAGIGVDECEGALKKFKAPDAYSRTKDFDGRRIEDIDGGWRLLNHAKYRAMMSTDDRREYQRLKQREYRARHKVKNGGKPLSGEVLYEKTGQMPHEFREVVVPYLTQPVQDNGQSNK